MKTILMCVCAVAACCCTVRADGSATYDGRTWSYYRSGTGILLSGVKPTAGKLVFPSSLDGYAITKIGNSLFANNNDITEIVIPDGITSIDASAFSACTALKTVSLPATFRTIESGAFQNCTSLEKVMLSDGITSIGERCFYGCSSLTAINLPTTLEMIGSNALTDTPVASSSGGDVVVDGCLIRWWGKCVAGQATVSKGVRLIAADAFTLNVSSRDAMRSLVFPNTAVRIGKGVLSGCYNLKNITYPASVKVRDMFGNYYDSDSHITNVVVTSGTRSIIADAFYNNENLQSVAIPRSVEEIGTFAFFGCTALKTVFVAPGDASRVRQMFEKSFSWSTPVSVDYCESESLRTTVPTLSDLQTSFADAPEVTENVTNAILLADFNDFLRTAGKTDIGQITAAEKGWAYQSFGLSEIVKHPELYTEEPRLSIADFAVSSGTCRVTVMLSVGDLAKELLADAVVKKIRVGEEVGAIDRPPEILSRPAEDGAALEYEIVPASATRSFVRIVVD